MNTNKHFIFVPGSFHGAWCWFKMQPLLNRNGNISESIDLPAHGLDQTSIVEVTLESYVNSVCEIIEKANKPVILVGHSRAGIVISQVAERIPSKIETLVYLAAYLIPDGEPMVAIALTDSNSLLVSNLIFNEAEGWHIPKKEIYREAFYHDCSEEDIALANTLLTREPIAPVATPLQLSNEKYGTVKKIYIQTTADKTLTPELQQKMINSQPVDKIYSMNTSHSPFLSKPRELAQILLNL